MVLISTDNQLNINEFRDALGATWPFLSDPDRVIQKDLDIKEFTDEPHDPMIPHTFVLGPGLRIFKVYNGYWYWGRPTMAELHVDLRALFQKIRPDFDLASPGLKEAWDRGDRDQFLVDTSRSRSATPRETASASNADHRRAVGDRPSLGPRRRGAPLVAGRTRRVRVPPRTVNCPGGLAGGLIAEGRDGDHSQVQGGESGATMQREPTRGDRDEQRRRTGWRNRRDGSRQRPVDLKLEVVVIPVADADRSKAFYAGLGWRLDADFSFDNGFRVVQFTPPGSPCSVQFGTHITDAPPGSAHGLYLDRVRHRCRA